MATAPTVSQTAQQAPPEVSKKAPAEVRFISQADRVCQRLDLLLDAEALKPKTASIQEIVKFAGIRADIEERTVTKLRRLKVPQSLAEPWRKLLSLRAELAHELREYGHAAAAADKSALGGLAKEKARVHKELGAVGGVAGFKVCSAVR